MLKEEGVSQGVRRYAHRLFPASSSGRLGPWRAGDGEVGGGQSPTPGGTGKAPLAWNRSFPTEPLLRSQGGGRGWCVCAAGRAEGSGAGWAEGWLHSRWGLKVHLQVHF